MIFIKVLDSRFRGNDGSSASRLRRRVRPRAPFEPAAARFPHRAPIGTSSPAFAGTGSADAGRHSRLRPSFPPQAVIPALGPSFPRKRESISLAAPCCKPRHCPYMTTGVIWRDEDDPRHPRRPAHGRPAGGRPARGRSAGAVFPAGVARSDRRRSRNPLIAKEKATAPKRARQSSHAWLIRLRGRRRCEPGFEAVRTLRRLGGWPNNRRAPFNRTLKGTPR